jgi:hypothetical protein
MGLPQQNGVAPATLPPATLTVVPTTNTADQHYTVTTQQYDGKITTAHCDGSTNNPWINNISCPEMASIRFTNVKGTFVATAVTADGKKVNKNINCDSYYDAAHFSSTKHVEVVNTNSGSGLTWLWIIVVIILIILIIAIIAWAARADKMQTMLNAGLVNSGLANSSVRITNIGTPVITSV